MLSRATVARRESAAPRADERTSDSLFPQRFTPFEYYYYVEHRPGYPSVFPIRVECRGRLERALFEKAFEQAHRRHPFLSARIQHEYNDWPSWVAGEPEPIEWLEGEDPSSDAPSTVPEPDGLKLTVRRQADKTVLLFVFPHVAVDGMGAFQFIADLMVGYAHGCAASPGEPPWPALDYRLLDDRDGHSLLKGRVRLTDLGRAARISLALLLRRAAVVDDHGRRPAAANDVASADDFLVHTLSEYETSELERVARKLSVRLHSLLLRDYYLMLAGWNQGTPESLRPIRMMVPINVRRKQDYRMPAANVFSYAFLTRREAECQGRSTLLNSIDTEMAAIKRNRRGLSYELGMRLLCLWPPLLRHSLNRKWAFATAVFSNLNAGFDHIRLPWRDGRRAAGDLILENGYGIGPIRPETRLCCAVHTYAGKLSICIRCDQKHFGREKRRDLLDALLTQLRETIQSET